MLIAGPYLPLVILGSLIASIILTQEHKYNVGFDIHSSLVIWEKTKRIADI
jgi:branched-subunit amino acid transport protein